MKLLASFVAAVLATSAIAEDYEARLREAVKATDAAQQTGEKEYIAELEKQGRALLKEFPDKDEPYQMLLLVAEFSDSTKARSIVEALSGDKVPAEARERAKGIGKRLDMIGKPIDLKFTAIDGREVDLAAMKGKVVLLDFWATWCPPCIAEMPSLKADYEKLHPKGFEIVGVSLDEDKAALEDFIKTKQISWPQFFDGKGWESVVVQRFGIQILPTMWLINKEGNLVDVAARGGLAEKIEKLLAK